VKLTLPAPCQARANRARNLLSRNDPNRRRKYPMTIRLPLALAAVAVLTGGFRPAAAADRTGEQIYKQMCAKCHGAAGEGSKDYPQPLAGDRSAKSLAKLIARTMPEDAPGTCVGEDAEKVAAYVYDTFYSPEARDRNKPPRVELARLTVKQYRNAVADLVGSFRPAAKWDDRRGLQAEYYKGRRFRPGDKVLSRTDPAVAFDFGTSAPADGIEAHEFSARWEGSVLAPETGDYEFVIRTEHAARLWVNDPARPLIDAWVKSGNDTEYKGSIYLLAGRPYHLRLEFSKAKQGVDDSKKQKKPPPSVKATVALLWKLPGREPEVIPQRSLSPVRAAEAFCVATPFPPDDRSLGWERGTTVSKAWDSATTDAAIETAGYVTAHIDELAGIRSGRREPGPGSGNPSQIDLDGVVGPPKPDWDRQAKLRAFGRRFAERAFRRPLTEDQARVFIDRQFETAKDPEAAVKRLVLFVLKTPRFLYRDVGGGPEGYAVAARLSFGLWDSLPDEELLKAAAAGKLATREQVVKQAERMLADPRAKAKLKGFFHHWLKVDHAPDVAKDPKRFPGFDAAVVSDLRTSLDLFLDDAAWGGDGDFRDLLTSEEVYLNGRLAKFYGADLPADAPFRKVTLDKGKRAGVLTHPYLLAAFAYTGSTSPIHRGVFLARGVLGIAMRPPPEAFTPLPEDLHPGLTTRERVALQTKPQACMSCHRVVNPLGFTLEKFDAVGRYREKENGKPVDATGAYQTRAGDTVTFADVRDLAAFLADSEEVHTAFVTQVFHHLVQQPVRAYGPNTLAGLKTSFAKDGFDVRKLMVEIMATAALPPRS
jgi:mono/diheme cytochrome c family protein